MKKGNWFTKTSSIVGICTIIAVLIFAGIWWWTKHFHNQNPIEYWQNHNNKQETVIDDKDNANNDDVSVENENDTVEATATIKF